MYVEDRLFLCVYTWDVIEAIIGISKYYQCYPNKVAALLTNICFWQGSDLQACCLAP